MSCRSCIIMFFVPIHAIVKIENFKTLKNNLNLKYTSQCIAWSNVVREMRLKSMVCGIKSEIKRPLQCHVVVVATQNFSFLLLLFGHIQTHTSIAAMIKREHVDCACQCPNCEERFFYFKSPVQFIFQRSCGC